jgi:hypothetical protein
VRTAKTRPALTESADKIIAMLPEDAANTIEGWIKAKNAAAAPAEEPPDETTASPSTPAPTSAAPAAPTASPSTSGADKQKLDTLINKGVPMPSPAAPAVVPTPRKT